MKEDPDPRLIVRSLQRQFKLDTRELKSFAEAAAAAVGVGGRGVTIVLVTDSRIQKLNREFRGYDQPTDVLSFEAGPGDYLGDVVISVETADRQAHRRGSHLKRELKVLVLHGLLHLAGYDHERDDGAMRRIEYRLRRKFGITTPRSAA